MSVARKAAIFVVLTFGISLVTLSIAWEQGMREMVGNINPPRVFQLALLGPAIAATICTVIFERGQRQQALGLRFVPNWWWLAALLVPAALGTLSIASNLIAAGSNLFDLGQWSQAVAAMKKSDGNGIFPNLAVAVIVMITVNTLTEELGWRGYLYHLWRRFGFATAALGAGALQGTWHWPLVLLFGIGFTGHPLIDMALYPLHTALLGPYHTLFRERGASVLAAGIFHGALNVLGGGGVGPGSYVVTIVLVLGAALILIHQRCVQQNPPSLSTDTAAPIPE